MKRIYLSNLLYLPLLVIGVLMLFVPQFIIDAFNVTIAVLLIFNGIKYLVDEYYVKNKKGLFNRTVSGIINIILGLIILVTDVSLVNILPFIIAFFFLIYSINSLVYLLKADSLQTSNSLRRIIMGSFAFLISLLLFYNPDQFSRFLVQLLGLSIILMVINVSFDIYRISKIPFVKRIKKK